MDQRISARTSLGDGVAGVLRAATLSVHAIGEGYAEVARTKPRFGVKQVDRFLSNSAIDVTRLTPSWAAFVVGARKQLVVALDWTDFEKDDHTTLAAYVVTTHGRPRRWRGRRWSLLGELVCLLERKEECAHDAEIYSAATGTWSIAANAAALPLDTGMTATALPSGQVLIVGGTNVPNRCTLYPTTGTAVSCAKPPQDFYGHTASLLANGKVLFAGGLGARGLNRTAYLYDPTKNTWTATGASTSTRLYGIASRLGDGRVLVTGGGVATAETYAPSTGTWTAQPSMSVARLGATLTALSTGKAVAAGGTGTTGAYLASAEEFDPSTNTWSPTSTMVTGRTGHVSVLLGNGEVLVATGSAASNHFLAAAELYTSSSAPPPPPANCDDGNACTTDTANPDGTCSHTAVANGTTCSDGSACTQADSCQAGVCVGADPVVCTASDACHSPGTCNPVDRRLLEPRCARRHDLLGRERVHDGRRVLGRHLCRDDARRLHGGGLLSHHWRVRRHNRRLLEPDRSQRDHVLGRQRVHAERQLPGRHLHRHGPGHLRRGGLLPRSGDLPPLERCLLDARGPERHHVFRRQRVHAER